MRFVTTYTEGRKPKNGLQIAFLNRIIAQLNEVRSAGLYVDGIGYWRQKVDIHAHDCQNAFSRCQPLHISEYNGALGNEIPTKFYIAIYGSHTDSIQGGTLLTIAVEEEQAYCKPMFDVWKKNSLSNHLLEYAKANYPQFQWRNNADRPSSISGYEIDTRSFNAALRTEADRVEAIYSRCKPLNIHHYEADREIWVNTNHLNMFRIRFNPIFINH